MHSLQTPYHHHHHHHHHRLQTASQLLSRNIKMHLLGVHFEKIHVKLLNQFHREKEHLQPFKDRYISAANHIGHAWAAQKLQNHNTHMPLISWASERTLLCSFGSQFSQMEQQKQQAYQPQVSSYQTECPTRMGMFCLCIGRAVATATCGNWALEMWLMQLRNWGFQYHFI